MTGAVSRAEEERSLIRSDLEMIQQAYFTEPDDQTAWWYHQYLIAWAARLQSSSPSSSGSSNDDDDFLEEILRGEIEAIQGLLEGDGTSYRWAVLTLASLFQRLSQLLSQKKADKDDACTRESQEWMKESKESYEMLIQMDPDHDERYQGLLRQLHE